LTNSLSLMEINSFDDRLSLRFLDKYYMIIGLIFLTKDLLLWYWSTFLNDKILHGLIKVVHYQPLNSHKNT